MPENLKAMTLRLQQDVPLAEASLDSALIAVSTLMTSVVTARQRVGVAPKAGQESIMRLAKAQLSLVEVSGDVLRVHGELADIAQETAGLDVHECRTKAKDNGAQLALVASNLTGSNQHALEEVYCGKT